MEKYQRINENSGIIAFQIKPDSIEIEFVNGERYIYDYKIPGAQKVEAMKKLARRGQGLSTFISQHVKDQYSSKN